MYRHYSNRHSLITSVRLFGFQADAVVDMIGYPQFIRDDAKLDEKYELVRIVSEITIKFVSKMFNYHTRLNGTIYFSWY